MKWYNSVKAKMIGFFFFVSLLFLTSILITFYIVRENNLLESASKSTALMTSGTLQEIKSRQVRSEEIVLTLASVSALFSTDLSGNTNIVKAIFKGNKHNGLNIVSGGIWFEPYLPDSRHKKNALFFNLDQNGSFILLKDYAKQIDYHAMSFYKLAKERSKGETAWTEVYTDPVTHVRMITAVSPIYHDNQFIGTASIDIAIKKNIQMLEQRHLPGIAENHYLIMLDKSGNFITRSKHLAAFSGESNIFHTQNPKITKLLKEIAPVLTNGKRENGRCYSLSSKEHNQTAQTLFEQIQENICIIGDDPFLHGKSVITIYHFPRTHWSVIIGISKAKVMAKQDELFHTILLITIVLTLFSTILGYVILQFLFVKPIKHINTQLQSAHSEHALLQCRDKGEIGTLVENFNARTLKLTKAKERESKEYQLRKTQEEMLIQQSKMAVMGEMMDSVAHQWKQPLNALTLYSELIRNDFEEGNVDQAYIEKFRKDIQLQIDHMVNTLDEFRSFFRPNKERHDFRLIEVLNSALFLAKDDILKNRILVKIEREDEIVINGFENEFKHLILNIINNAKDAFVENNIAQRLIIIRLIRENNSSRMEIEDNAGGIPETVIEKIFDANVTTKAAGKGTGIGLYLSRQIAQKHHAVLYAENREKGACFIVRFTREG
jgi:signal transduction histidine kinase